MADYLIRYKDLQSQADVLQGIGKTLASFESRLNTVANTMDSRDDSLASLKSQVKKAATQIAPCVKRVVASGTAVGDISALHLSAEKSVYGSIAETKTPKQGSKVMHINTGADETGPACNSSFGPYSEIKENPYYKVYNFNEIVIKTIKDYFEEFLDKAIPDWLKEALPVTKWFGALMTSMKLVDIVGSNVACGASTGRVIGELVGEAAHIAAKKVFGTVGKEVGSAIGNAICPAGIGWVAGRLTGKTAGVFLADYLFNDQASTLFGLVEVDGLNWKDIIADNVANLVDATISGQAYSAGYA